MAQGPKTDHTLNHNHRYQVDANGNGRTSTDCHPQNPNICHSHEIKDFIVLQTPSSCYPNCTGIGAPGLPNHSHNISIPCGAITKTTTGQRRYNKAGPQGTTRTVRVNARRSTRGNY